MATLQKINKLELEIAKIQVFLYVDAKIEKNLPIIEISNETSI